MFVFTELFDLIVQLVRHPFLFLDLRQLDTSLQPRAPNFPLRGLISTLTRNLVVRCRSRPLFLLSQDLSILPLQLIIPVLQLLDLRLLRLQQLQLRIYLLQQIGYLRLLTSEFKLLRQIVLCLLFCLLPVLF